MLYDFCLITLVKSAESVSRRSPFDLFATQTAFDPCSMQSALGEKSLPAIFRGAVQPPASLSKPFNSEELTTRVEKLLEQRALLREKFAKQLSAAPKPGDNTEKKSADDMMPELDRRFLNKLTDCIYLMLGSHKGIDVEAVASKLCMSYGQMNRKLTALTGYTPAQYIQRIKIKKAQRMLLAHPELDFNSIAEQCGFSDYSNFVRAFRKVVGLTPTQFIRKE